MRTCLFTLLLMIALPSFANDGYITARKLEPQQLPALARTLDEQMREGGRFAHVSADERERVNAALAEMLTLLEGKQSTTDLNADDRARLINAQERANAILTQRDGERLICERRSRVGTHHKETTCETYNERMARQDRARKGARDLELPRGCGLGADEAACPDFKGKSPMLNPGGGSP